MPRTEKVTDIFCHLNLPNRRVFKTVDVLLQDTTIIALTNSAVSIFAGFVVYAIIGNVAHEFNLPVEEAAESNGPSLAFITYPTGMLAFDEGVSNLMSAIFFLILFSLGIDSAFALVEACATALKEMPRFK